MPILLNMFHVHSNEFQITTVNINNMAAIGQQSVEVRDQRIIHTGQTFEAEVNQCKVYWNLDCQCRLVSDFLLDFLTSHRPGRH